MNWTEKIVELGEVRVGEAIYGDIDLAFESFEVREVKGECQCLDGKMSHGVLVYQYVAQPFPPHLEYKDSYNTHSIMVLATTQGRKQIRFNVTIKK